MKPRVFSSGKGTIYLVLLLTAITTVGFQVGEYYRFRSLFPRSPASHISTGKNNGSDSSNHVSNPNSSYVLVSTIINYGNGSIVWFNQTRILRGENFYNLTVALAKVDSKYYPDLNENYILGINGVEEKLPFYWSLWIFCNGERGWMNSPVGADEIQLFNGGIYGWYYQSENAIPPVPPVPGAYRVGLCSNWP